jgi:16S rRNA processing protein RimM
MNNLVWVGSSAGPVGLKGEIKIITDINHQDKIFKVNNKLWINNVSYIIKTVREFKHNYIVSFEQFDDINQIDLLLHQDIFMNKEDIGLDKNEFLFSEIINFAIIDNQKKIGVVKEILLNKKDYFIKDGSLIIPMIDK